MNVLLPPPKQFRVEIAKISAYLLNTNHPKQEARAKAAFFTSRGFDPSRPLELADALTHHAQNSRLVGVVNNAYANKFIYEGDLYAPDGSRISKIRSVWKIERQPDLGELVTAHRY